LGAQGPDVVKAGGAVVEILMTGSPGAAHDGLDAWIEAYNLDVTTVAPTDGFTMSELGVRETCFIVDLSTMKIVWKDNGSLAGIGDSSAKTGIAKILTLLP
jgi:hypothetical protein